MIDMVDMVNMVALVIDRVTGVSFHFVLYQIHN